MEIILSNPWMILRIKVEENSNRHAFLKELEQYKKLIDEYSQEMINKFSGPKVLTEAMHYAVQGNGKRLRPILLIESASLFNLDVKMSLNTSVAVEFAHCYSLAHDDLPSMDNDLLRRGKPTLHVKFDEATAILAGNALLTLAFQCLTLNASIFSSEKINKLVSCFSESLGARGLVGGQFLDLNLERFENKIIKDQLELIQMKKTAALISFSCQAGGILGGAKQYELDILQSFGKDLGRMFQITDDLLDEEGDKNVVGKNLNKDLKNNKVTALSVLGIKQAKSEVVFLQERAKDSLNKLGKNSKNLKKIIDFIANRKY